MREIISLIQKTFSFLAVYLFSTLHASAGEGDISKSGPVQSRFVTEREVHLDSKEIEIGWWMKRDPGWHTYWESPGDVGVPPTLSWQLPQGVNFEKLTLSPPQLVRMSQVFAHGHKGESLFLCSFKIDRELIEGETLDFEANASWLACSKTCLPSFAKLKISLNVSEKPLVDSKWRPYFLNFRNNLPVLVPENWEPSAIQRLSEKSDALISLMFPLETKGSLPGMRFFGKGRMIRSNQIQIPRILKNENGKQLIEISMELSPWRNTEQNRLEGLLYNSSGWPNTKSKFYQIDVPILQ